MLLLEGLNLHVASARALSQRPLRRRGWRAPCSPLHLAAYVAAVFLVLSPGKALVFVAVHQAIFGLYMGVSFAPNHKGMPMLSARDDNSTSCAGRSSPLATSRGGRSDRHPLGGLNYQIEHHLFPSMPQPNLRHAQPLVRAFCAERGVPYTECGVLESYRQSLVHLDTVGRGR